MYYYNFAHSSGTFGAVGVAAGVGRIYGFTKEQMNNVLSVAEFNAPSYRVYAVLSIPR